MRLNFKERRNPGGFTVLEIFIATGVLLIIASIMGRFFFLGKRSYEESVGATVLQGASRKALLSMLAELQESREIIYPKDELAATKTDRKVEVRNSELQTIKYALEDDSIKRYVLSSDDLQERKNGDVIVTHVKELKFTRYSAKLLGVRIVVTTNEKDEDKRQEEQIITSFFLRNKL